MKHYGDIVELNGAALPEVDVIIGGSPCQDLSIAGRRAGLAGERSGLFTEQIRIVKEMRNESKRRNGTNGDIKPRFMVWENVPGAFSSNGGGDFHVVLEEIAHVVDEDAVIPRPPRGKWSTAGCVMADGWSIAWRVCDAQFWGVPQRRRRIALIADFGGQRAAEILFERKSVRGNIETGSETRKESAGDTREGSMDTGADGIAYCIQGNSIERSDNAGCGGKGWTEDVCYTLNTIDRPAVVYAIDSAAYNQGVHARYDFEVRDDGTTSTLVNRHPSAVCYAADARNGTLGQNMPTLQSAMPHSLNAGGLVVYDARGNGEGSVAPTVTGDHESRVTDYTAVVCYAIGNGQADQTDVHERAGALNCMHDQQAVMIHNDDSQWVVRRLTPLECERLQGFPDGWTDIGEWTDSKGRERPCADTQRYKALGNSIALPQWRWLCKRISAEYDRPATMGGLFDGIGGFPLVWESVNGKGSCLWASEIDEFCNAVTERRFENNG